MYIAFNNHNAKKLFTREVLLFIRVKEEMKEGTYG